MENKNPKNAGRKTVYHGEKMIRVSGRLTERQWEALKKAGGFTLIRRIVDFCLLSGDDLRQFVFFEDKYKKNPPKQKTKKNEEEENLWIERQVFGLD